MDEFTRRRLARELDEELSGAGAEALDALNHLGFDLSTVSSVEELHALVEQPLQECFGRLHGWPGLLWVRQRLERGDKVPLRSKIGVLEFDVAASAMQVDDSDHE